MKSLQLLILALTALVAVLQPQAVAQSSAEARVKAAGILTITMTNIPPSDAPMINLTYRVDRDGTIKMPHLANRLKVVGLNQRQVEDLVTNVYISEQIYSKPVVMAVVGTGELTNDLRFIHVTGYVGGKRNLPFREGITLIEALVDCGDITDFGSRKIQITRNGVTRTYDYFSARDRAIVLLPKDQVHVPARGPFESRPNKIGP